jgi:hypothetical protein
MAFLERDIKARKQAFGIIAYDILEKSEENSGGGGGDDDGGVQKAFGECRGDIFALESKLNSKKREMDAIDASHGGGGAVGGAGGGGGVGGEDAEAPGIPQNP